MGSLDAKIGTPGLAHRNRYILQCLSYLLTLLEFPGGTYWGGEYREGLRPVFSIATHSQPSAVYRMQPTFLVYKSPFPSNVLPSELSHFPLMMMFVELEHLW